LASAGTKKAQPDRRWKECPPRRCRLRTGSIVQIAGVVALADLLVPRFINALILAGIERHKETGQIPGGGALRQNLGFQRRAPARADEIQAEGIHKLLANFDGSHGSLTELFCLLPRLWITEE